jgi:hypothetical protein
METCRLLTAAALSSRSYAIKIIFSLLMSPSLVCWIGPTAVRKKAARVPLGRGLIEWIFVQIKMEHWWNRFKTAKNPKENPFQPMNFKNPNKKIRKPEVFRVLPYLYDLNKKIHRVGYGFKNLKIL